MPGITPLASNLESKGPGADVAENNTNLSTTEKQELRMNKTNLVNMLEEVIKDQIFSIKQQQINHQTQKKVSELKKAIASTSTSRPALSTRTSKSSNVLLDYHLCAKVANFDLARTGCNVVTTRIVVTQGYIARRVPGRRRHHRQGRRLHLRDGFARARVKTAGDRRVGVGVVGRVGVVRWRRRRRGGTKGATSADEDLRELIRVASLKRSRSLGLATCTTPPPPLRTALAVPRSQSVAVGRIDEDKRCDFGDEETHGP
ncbi:hypothetical protein Cni_G04149 [Canna indica]|uniref:Uncharacterized protein n=1 Tax=Canna indica TaxID=4628 RepID=A0AAQ3JT03_9LILI|nr:hypothetical protein Cni_G04149 [Canna indica]